MIKFYYNTSPNPMKIALCLEEMNLSYEAIPIDTRKGDQHSDSYKAINPNAKAPAIEDDGHVVFDSNAILLYLGEKTNKFMPNNDLKSKSELYSWLMFVATGIGPYSGQSVHFQHMAPEKNKYAIKKENFLGHSDISPIRKIDPGENFPWKKLSEHNIGQWFTQNKKILTRHEKKRRSTFFKNLHKIGYRYFSVHKRNYNDKKVIKSFQQHYLPKNVTGKLDQKTFKISYFLSN